MPHDDHAPMALQLEYYPAQKYGFTTVWSSICTTTSHGQFYFDGVGLQELILSPYPANTKRWPSVG